MVLVVHHGVVKVDVDVDVDVERALQKVQIREE
jgi:hypothetical protein